MFSDRSLHPISKIDVEKLSTGVFNIEVSKNHNYYVGRNGVLAHNKDCFLAGTMVLLPDGRKIAIEMVKKGDFVVSYNLVTGTNQKSVVLETMRHLVEREIFTIKVSEDQIRATGVHKFYVNRNGSVDWIPAEELVVGDFVMLSNGNWNAIESIEMEVQLTRVYNLHVSDMATLEARGIQATSLRRIRSISGRRNLRYIPAFQLGSKRWTSPISTNRTWLSLVASSSKCTLARSLQTNQQSTIGTSSTTTNQSQISGTTRLGTSSISSPTTCVEATRQITPGRSTTAHRQRSSQ